MYDVAVLFERSLIEIDIDQILALHEGVEDDVAYHLLLPVPHPDLAISASMAAFAGGPIIPVEETEALDAISHDLREESEHTLQAAASLLRDHGATVTATLTDGDPIETLEQIVTEHACVEAIILTEPHLVQEFLHLDWTSRARRKLKIPTLHLLEHYSFDQQADL